MGKTESREAVVPFVVPKRPTLGRETGERSESTPSKGSKRSPSGSKLKTAGRIAGSALTAVTLLASAKAGHDAGAQAYQEAEAFKDAAIAKVERVLGVEDVENEPQLIDQRLQTELDIVYPGLTPSEYKQAFTQILEQEQIIATDYLVGPEDFQRVGQHLPLIKKYAKEYKVPENLLLGMLIIESRGDPTAHAEDGGMGVMQYQIETAQELGVDPWNPEDSIRGAAKYMAESYENRWGDWGLCVWEWNVGAGQIYNAIRVYASASGRELPDITEVSAKDAPAVVADYKNTVNKMGINAFRLLSHPQTKAIFEAPGFFLTSIYDDRTLAAAKYFSANVNFYNALAIDQGTAQRSNQEPTPRT